MTETWITDLTPVLTPQGAIAPSSSPARRFAERLTRLVVAATPPPEAEAKPSPAPCGRRPGRRRCAGVLATALDPATGEGVWGCPVRGQPGRIHRAPASNIRSREPDFDPLVALALAAKAQHLHPADLGEAADVGAAAGLPVALNSPKARAGAPPKSRRRRERSSRRRRAPPRR